MNAGPRLTPDQIKGACGGQWLARPLHPARAVAGVSIDSRTIAPGEAYFALRGTRHDGHDFVASAGKSAGLVVVERAPAKGEVGPGVGVIKVPDARRALGQVARQYRRGLQGTRVIAVGGSNGKTTTVRLLDAVLGAGGGLRGRASIKSYNNDVGVPLTLLGARAGDQYVICEAGTNAPGEMGALGAIMEPDLAVITSIGREHLERLETLEGVAHEEGALFGTLRPGGLGVAPADAPLLREHLGLAPSVVTFGEGAQADLRLTECRHEWAGGVAGLRFGVNGRGDYRLGMVGRHNARNALAAIAVARRLGVEDAAIVRGLAGARGPEMRWERSVVNGVEFINDAYNANPESVLAALGTLRELHPPGSRRRVVVLGDMLEMGAGGPAAHREVGEAIARGALADHLITVGALARLAGEAAAGAGVPWEAFDAVGPAAMDAVRGADAPGSIVLIKGSRGNRLERLLPAPREVDAAAAGLVGPGARSAAS